MNKLKFRAWDKDNKIMLYQLEDSPAFGRIKKERYCSFEDVFFYQKEDFQTMQYIGLNDKNGTDIYTGDICLIHTEEINEQDGYFIVKFDNGTARFILDGEGLNLDFDNIYSTECEIMGNIYQNSELINK